MSWPGLPVSRGAEGVSRSSGPAKAANAAS